LWGTGAHLSGDIFHTFAHSGEVLFDVLVMTAEHKGQSTPRNNWSRVLMTGL